MFFKPPAEEGGEPELITGGPESLQEMRTFLSEHLEESMFGLIRMGFGVGRLRRTKHVFVHAVGPQASAVKRGKIGGQLSRMKQWVEVSTNVSVHIEVEDEEALTAENVVARVRKAAHLDEEEVAWDEGLKDIFTVEGMEQAHMEERTKMQVPGEAEALEEVADMERKQWMELPLDELLRLFHYEGAPNWVLFGPGESWSGAQAPLPGYVLQSGKLKPGVRFGAAAGGGGFLQAEERRRSAIEEAAAQKAATAGPPVMTFGDRSAKGVGDQKLAAMLARQREKQRLHHMASMDEMAATVEEETEEQASDYLSDLPPTGTTVTQAALPSNDSNEEPSNDSNDLPLTTTKAGLPPLTTMKASGGDPSTQSSPGPTPAKKQAELREDNNNAAGSTGQVGRRSKSKDKKEDCAIS